MKTVRKYRQNSGKEKTADRKYAEYHYECLSPIQKKYYKEIHKSILENNDCLFLTVDKNNVEMDLQKALLAFTRDHVKMSYKLTGKYSLSWSSRTRVFVELKQNYYLETYSPKHRIAEITKVAGQYHTSLMKMAVVYEYIMEHIRICDGDEKLIGSSLMNAAIFGIADLEGAYRLLTWTLRELGIDCGIIYQDTRMYCMVNIGEVGCIPIDFGICKKESEEGNVLL